MCKVIDQPFFCSVPFTTLIFYPNGTVGTCRELGNEHIVGDINKQSIEEIWNGKELQQLRKELISGNLKKCKFLQETTSCNKLNDNVKMNKTLVDTNIVTNNKIRRLSPDFNSACNLKCPMCNIWSGDNGFYDKINFWGTLEKDLLPEVYEIELLSGEPFVQQDFYRLIQSVYQINKDIKFRITTNGHWKLTKFIKEKLNLIKLDYISISLDALDKSIYKEIRTGDVSLVLQTVKQLITFRDKEYNKGHFNIIINFTVQRKNWKDIIAVIKFAKRNGLLYFPQYLINPSKLSILTLKDEEREEILKWYIQELLEDEILFIHRLLRVLIISLDPVKRERYLSLLNVVTKGKFNQIY